MQVLNLTFGRAVEAAAKQNFERDVRLGATSEVEREMAFPEYVSEARAYLQTHGQNLEPMFEDHPHIVVVRNTVVS